MKLTIRPINSQIDVAKSFNNHSRLFLFGKMNGNLKKISDKKHYDQILVEALKEMDKLETGKFILKTLKDVEIELVCYKGAAGEFLVKEETLSIDDKDCNVEKPTILWDPFVNFKYYGRENNDKNSTKYYKAEMPSWMVLAHELGHAVHYVTKNKEYVKCIKEGNTELIEEWNLADHEQKLCSKSGFAQRMNYKDFQAYSLDGTEINYPSGLIPLKNIKSYNNIHDVDMAYNEIHKIVNNK
ncbi:MAG: hypothetical protein HOO91_16835 [Bacteroidales bacterium]|nr:hypothetical protein [Bacteroidales bacterium]